MGEDGNATFHLNPALVDWAFNLTKDVVIPDTPEMKHLRMQFDGDDGSPSAVRPARATTSPPAPSGTAS